MQFWRPRTFIVLPPNSFPLLQPWNYFDELESLNAGSEDASLSESCAPPNLESTYAWNLGEDEDDEDDGDDAESADDTPDDGGD
jgi:hypothetical protein